MNTKKIKEKVVYFLSDADKNEAVGVVVIDGQIYTKRASFLFSFFALRACQHTVALFDFFGAEAFEDGKVKKSAVFESMQDMERSRKIDTATDLVPVITITHEQLKEYFDISL